MRRYAVFVGEQEIMGAGNTKAELDQWVTALNTGEVREVELTDGETVSVGLIVPESVLAGDA